MASQARNVNLDLGGVRGVHDVRDRVKVHRMAQAVLQRKNGHSVLSIVIVGQCDLAIEDGQQMFGRDPFRRRVGTVAFQAERVALRPQQMFVVVTMRFVADGATLLEGRLVQNALL